MDGDRDGKFVYQLSGDTMHHCSFVYQVLEDMFKWLKNSDKTAIRLAMHPFSVKWLGYSISCTDRPSSRP